MDTQQVFYVFEMPGLLALLVVQRFDQRFTGPITVAQLVPQFLSLSLFSFLVTQLLPLLFEIMREFIE